MSSGIRAYVAIARPDHWFKNVFVLPGVAAALATSGMPADSGALALNLLLALASVCLVASSNYVINEILDAPNDRLHPEKRHRPIPSGLVRLPIAYAEWVLLGAAGLGVGALVSWPFFGTSVALLFMGLLYNVRPFRTKEVPILDVISESVNNPIRMLMGWYAAGGPLVPPASLLVAYWMIGAYFMAVKRLAEYRHLADPALAASYRKSFAWYTQERLLVTLMVYASACALFLGVFLMRYRIELILCAPFFAIFMGLYLRIGLKPDSPAMNPEKLYRQQALMFWLVLSVAMGVVLLFVDVPVVREIFQPTVEPQAF